MYVIRTTYPHARLQTSRIEDNRSDNKMESSIEDKQNPITVNYSTLVQNAGRRDLCVFTG